MAKYCKRSHTVSKKWDIRKSQTWKKLIVNKKEVEQHILWRLQSGNSIFWWDNQLGTGSLFISRPGGGRLSRP